MEGTSYDEKYIIICYQSDDKCVLMNKIFVTFYIRNDESVIIDGCSIPSPYDEKYLINFKVKYFYHSRFLSQPPGHAEKTFIRIISDSDHALKKLCPENLNVNFNMCIYLKNPKIEVRDLLSISVGSMEYYLKCIVEDSKIDSFDDLPDLLPPGLVDHSSISTHIQCDNMLLSPKKKYGILFFNSTGYDEDSFSLFTFDDQSGSIERYEIVDIQKNSCKTDCFLFKTNDETINARFSKPEFEKTEFGHCLTIVRYTHDEAYIKYFLQIMPEADF